MFERLTCLATAAAITLLLAAPPPPPRVRDSAAAASPSLVVHEWGTFTSATAPDGHALPWMTLSGPDDLPSFVWRENDCFHGKGGFATIRMETPVVYFYSKEPVTATVDVRFPGGTITEWYPKATRVAPFDRTKPMASAQGGIRWEGIEVIPGATPALPREQAPNHYYAARETAAAPVRAGGQWEKLLFYRGIGSFYPPVRPALVPGGERVAIAGSVPAGLLFLNRGGRIGFAPLAADTKIPDATETDATAVKARLERMLVESGLYEDEARAMVETWKDSWFEEGLRVFYLVPEKFKNEALPLEVTPRPGELRRVFVGRAELFPAWVARDARKSLEDDDAARFAQRARFFDPIAQSYQGMLRGVPFGKNIQNWMNARWRSRNPCQAQ